MVYGVLAIQKSAHTQFCIKIQAVKADLKTKLQIRNMAIINICEIHIHNIWAEYVLCFIKLHYHSKLTDLLNGMT